MLFKYAYSDVKLSQTPSYSVQICLIILIETRTRYRQGQLYRLCKYIQVYSETQNHIIDVNNIFFFFFFGPLFQPERENVHMKPSGRKIACGAKNIFGHVLALPLGRFRRKFKKTCKTSSGENGRETGENSH